MKSSSLLERGAAVSVGRADGESLALQADFVLETRRHFFSHLGSDGTVVDGHQDGGPAVGGFIGPDCQGAGLEPAGDACGLGLAASVAHQANRVAGVMSSTATPTGICSDASSEVAAISTPATIWNRRMHRMRAFLPPQVATHQWRADSQYLQLVTSPPGGAVFKRRSTILGAYIW